MLKIVFPTSLHNVPALQQTNKKDHLIRRQYH